MAKQTFNVGSGVTVEVNNQFSDNKDFTQCLVSVKEGSYGFSFITSTGKLQTLAEGILSFINNQYGLKHDRR